MNGETDHQTLNLIEFETGETASSPTLVQSASTSPHICTAHFYLLPWSLISTLSRAPRSEPTVYKLKIQGSSHLHYWVTFDKWEMGAAPGSWKWNNPVDHTVKQPDRTMLWLTSRPDTYPGLNQSVEPTSPTPLATMIVFFPLCNPSPGSHRGARTLSTSLPGILGLPVFLNY